MFQSSPVLWDGRYDIAAEVERRRQVSILARPVGRALQGRLLSMKAVLGFNPRPSCGTGATDVTPDLLQRLSVSILARPVGRALQ